MLQRPPDERDSQEGVAGVFGRTIEFLAALGRLLQCSHQSGRGKASARSPGGFWDLQQLPVLLVHHFHIALYLHPPTPHKYVTG